MERVADPERRGGIWWTQPKLALVFIGANAVAFAVIVLGVSVPAVEIGVLLAVQSAMMLAYVRAASRLGARHLAGATEDAFEANIWNKRWNPSRDKYTHPPDVVPRAGGGSFYQQLLGDTPEARAALYRAMSLWEGARLLWVGNTAAVFAAVGFSTVGLAMTRFAGQPRPAALIASGLAVPVCLLLLPESINIMLLKRSILRHGVVPRTAVLVPRDAIDLGLGNEPVVPQGIWREIIVLLIIFSGIPVFAIVTLAAGSRIAILGAAAIAAAILVAVWAFRAFMRLLVSGIPFLQFGNSVEVSVLLDLAHRQRARMSLAALWPMLYVLSWYPGDATPSVLPLVIALGCILATTFGDQLSGYAGFVNATHFEDCFKRSLAKLQATTA